MDGGASVYDYGNTQDHLWQNVDDLGRGSMVVGGLDVTVDLSNLNGVIDQAFKDEKYVVDVDTTR